ncbi:hypothetical protein ACP70R_048135 [Stipagrostis hirtigluma subsp. patula]
MVMLSIRSSRVYYCRLLNPATGSVHLLPEGDGAVDVRERHISSAQIGPTGAHKVLRVVYFTSNDHSTDRHVYEVFVIDGHGQARWMGKKASPQVNLDLSTSVVVKNIVYFLVDTLCCAHHQDVEADQIVSFDLEKEEWRETLRGPLSSRDTAGWFQDEDSEWTAFSLATLNGCLVGVHDTLSTYVDLWFLMDCKKGL